jgi:hypothetical protein
MADQNVTRYLDGLLARQQSLTDAAQRLAADLETLLAAAESESHGDLVDVLRVFEATLEPFQDRAQDATWRERLLGWPTELPDYGDSEDD